MITTEELLQRCSSKDPAAWDEFVKRYKGIVTRSVRYKLKRMKIPSRKNHLQDIVQEIFLSIWSENKLLNVKDSSTLKGWIAIVSINAAFNYFKNKHLKIEEDMSSIDDECISGENCNMPLNPILSSSKFSIEKTLESNELGRIIKKEVSKLSIKQRLAVKFHIYHGKRQEDVAKIMNMPRNTVATLIRRAKKKLREGLKETLDDKH